MHVQKCATNVLVYGVGLHTIMGQIQTSSRWGPGSPRPPVGCATDQFTRFTACINVKTTFLPVVCRDFGYRRVSRHGRENRRTVCNFSI